MKMELHIFTSWFYVNLHLHANPEPLDELAVYHIYNMNISPVYC